MYVKGRLPKMVKVARRPDYSPFDYQWMRLSTFRRFAGTGGDNA